MPLSASGLGTIGLLAHRRRKRKPTAICWSASVAARAILSAHLLRFVGKCPTVCDQSADSVTGGGEL